MKNLILVLFSICIMVNACNGQSNDSQQQDCTITQNDNNAAYSLFPTKNMWTFIKLDTRNGRLWLVQYSIEDEKRFEYILNTTPRVPESEQYNGRFTLYPTQNTYNFLLLDQADGQVWQVQWSFEREERFVIPIY